MFIRVESHPVDKTCCVDGGKMQQYNSRTTKEDDHIRGGIISWETSESVTLLQVRKSIDGLEMGPKKGSSVTHHIECRQLQVDY